MIDDTNSASDGNYVPVTAGTTVSEIIPQAAAVIMQYTGYTALSKQIRMTELQAGRQCRVECNHYQIMGYPLNFMHMMVWAMDSVLGSVQMPRGHDAVAFWKKM